MIKKLAEKIILQAIDLFNKEGVTATSLRKISGELNISDGHLRYYFKTKEDLIIAVYQKLLEFIDPIEENLPKDIPLWKNIVLQLKGAFMMQSRFSWLYCESFILFKKYPKLKEKHIEIQRMYQEQFFEENRKNIRLGIFNESLTESRFAILQEQFVIYVDSWILHNFKRSKQRRITEKQIEHYVAVVIGLFLPYFNAELQSELEIWVGEKILRD